MLTQSFRISIPLQPTHPTLQQGNKILKMDTESLSEAMERTNLKDEHAIFAIPFIFLQLTHSPNEIRDIYRETLWLECLIPCCNPFNIIEFN